MADELLTILTRFHRELVAPDIDRIISLETIEAPRSATLRPPVQTAA